MTLLIAKQSNYAENKKETFHAKKPVICSWKALSPDS
jgi:hypothetical protein